MDKDSVAELLQRAGVPAAPMNRAVDVLADPVLLHRNSFTEMVHPLFDQPMPTETDSGAVRHIPRADLRPAPMPGEHTREICQKLLCLDTDEIDRLIADGVLFTSANPTTPRTRFMTAPRTPVLVGYGQVNQLDENPGDRTDRPDGGGGARGRRPPRPAGRRLRAHRQHPVLALPRPRPPARAAHQRRRGNHPLHGRRRQCAADIGQQGVPGHPGRPRRYCSDRGRRNLSHPNAIA